MKRITVKDKMLLHIQHYKGYEKEYELPVALTQDGIAEALGISRSHAAITLLELKEKEYVRDQLARVKGLHRQRKVYFLTSRGDIYINRLKDIYTKKTVMIKDMDGNETEITITDLSVFLYPYIKKYLTIYDIFKHLDKENIFDSQSFVEKTKAEEVVNTKTEADEKSVEKELKLQSVAPIPPFDQVIARSSQTQPIPDGLSPTLNPSPVLAAQQPQGQRQTQGSTPYLQNPARQPIRHYPPNPKSSNAPDPYFRWYYYSRQYQDLHSNMYYNYSQYYYPQQYPWYPYRYRINTPEERKERILEEMMVFFSISAFFCVLSFFSIFLAGGICFPGYFIITILGLIMALIGFSIGFKRIAFIGNKGRRIILGMGIFFVANFLVMLETMLFNFIVYLDIARVGPIILTMLGFLGLITLVKPLKTKYRTELAFSVGIFCLLFGVFSGLLLPGYYLTNPFVFAPFWILFGITCMVVGNELIGKIQPKEKFTKIINFSIVGTGAFLCLTILTRLFVGEYDPEMLHLSYLSDICWFGVGVYLISFRVVKKDFTTKMLAAIKISLPIGMGLLFILFGIFLGLINKFIEGLVEIIIGAVIIRYGLTKNIFSESKPEMLIKLSFPIFILISESVTFYLILYG